MTTLLLAFYLTTSEWCHCQRDIWMLLPCLVALQIRRRQAERLAVPEVPTGRLLLWAFAEGLAWGAAVWLKPFVVVPGLACWLISAAATRPRRRLLGDLAGLMGGGLVAGGAGIAWLATTGAWPKFVEVMFVWNGEYFAYDTTGGAWWSGPAGLVARFFPWVLLHILAVPVATAAIWPWRRNRPPVPPLLAAFYLAWLLQAVVLQHVFDYVHVPPILLAATVLAAYGLDPCNRGGRLVLVLLVACAAWTGPELVARGGAAWGQCVAEGSKAAVRDRVRRLDRIDWTDLGRVEDFLRGRDVRDGELTCFSMSTISLYGDMDLKPSNALPLPSRAFEHLRQPAGLDPRGPNREPPAVRGLRPPPGRLGEDARRPRRRAR